jgi:foldase protein PrsA
MRNIKLLWATTAFLAVCTLVLLVALVNDRIHSVEPSPDHDLHDGTSEDAGSVVAVIGGKKITSGEWQKNTLNRYGKEILNQMLDRAAIRLESEALGITVTDSDIDREIKQMQEGYEDEDAFYQAMKEVGMDKESLKTETYYKLLLERIATRDIKITDKEVDQYLAAHPGEVQAHNQIRFREIVTSTLEKAQQIVKQLNKGVSFEILAKDQSLDDATRNDGGDRGWVEENDPFVDSRILQAAKALEINEISAPIKLGGVGYAIIQVTGRKNMDPAQQAEIREKIRRQLALQKAPSLNDLTRQLREKYQAQVLDPALR